MDYFSHRMGIRSLRDALQSDSMDAALRNRLWNVLTNDIWSRRRFRYGDLDSLEGSASLNRFVRALWQLHFKVPLDTLGHWWHEGYQDIRSHFMECPWWAVYDFLDFASAHYPGSAEQHQNFLDSCNAAMEAETSAYRFVAGQIAPMIGESEIDEVDAAASSPVEPVAHHIATAVTHLADRDTPDYRNSVKESISAVESLCQAIAGDASATLGQALDVVERTGKVELHGALKAALKKLYGYTSDADGIRHALSDAPTLTFDDAKFMLVACSAFVNYLQAKATAAGVDLSHSSE